MQPLLSPFMRGSDTLGQQDMWQREDEIVLCTVAAESRERSLGKSFLWVWLWGSPWLSGGPLLTWPYTVKASTSALWMKEVALANRAKWIITHCCCYCLSLHCPIQKTGPTESKYLLMGHNLRMCAFLPCSPIILLSLEDRGVNNCGGCPLQGKLRKRMELRPSTVSSISECSMANMSGSEEGYSLPLAPLTTGLSF